MTTSICISPSVHISEKKVAPRTIVSSVLFPRDHRFWMEERPIQASLDIVDDAGFKINVQGAGNMLSRARLREEGRKAGISGRWRAFHDTTIRLEEYMRSAKCKAKHGNIH